MTPERLEELRKEVEHELWNLNHPPPATAISGVRVTKGRLYSAKAVGELLDHIAEQDREMETYPSWNAAIKRIQELEDVLEPLGIAYQFEMRTSHPGTTMGIAMSFLRKADWVLGKANA